MLLRGLGAFVLPHQGIAFTVQVIMAAGGIPSHMPEETTTFMGSSTAPKRWAQIS